MLGTICQKIVGPSRVCYVAPLMPTPFTWIDTPDDLNDAVERMRQADAIALDTEFVWKKTYYAQLGLVQVGFVDGTCYLIDAVALGDLSPLGTILADAGIIKILHDAPQDLMILRRATGALTRTVFDTRRAAGFAGFASTISLGHLLADLLDVHLAKAHTRADWLARPLAAGVLEYAADDVHYLPTVAARLRERAHANGVEAWLNEELAGLDAPAITAEPDPGEAGQRLRTRQPLPPRAQAVLNELAAWRENRARLADLPRRWLMKDNVLIAMALQMPQTMDELTGVNGMPAKTVQHRGDELLAAIARGLAQPEADGPVAAPALRRDGALRKEVDALLELIRTHATQLGIDPALVCSRNELAALVQAGADAQPQDHKLLHGWRSEFLRTAGIPVAGRQG